MAGTPLSGLVSHDCQIFSVFDEAADKGILGMRVTTTNRATCRCQLMLVPALRISNVDATLLNIKHQSKTE